MAMCMRQLCDALNSLQPRGPTVALGRGREGFQRTYPCYWQTKDWDLCKLHWSLSVASC